jgi:hypothetical protein
VRRVGQVSIHARHDKRTIFALVNRPIAATLSQASTPRPQLSPPFRLPHTFTPRSVYLARGLHLLFALSGKIRSTHGGGSWEQGPRGTKGMRAA